jgi:hypothetical protein
MLNNAHFETSTHVFVHGSAGAGAQWRDIAALLPLIEPVAFTLFDRTEHRASHQRLLAFCIRDFSARAADHAQPGCCAEDKAAGSPDAATIPSLVV